MCSDQWFALHFMQNSRWQMAAALVLEHIDMRVKRIRSPSLLRSVSHNSGSPARLQSGDHHLCNSPHQIVAELGVFFSGDEQVSAIQNHGAGRLHSSGLEMPDKGREQPGPPDDLARAKRLDQNHFTLGSMPSQSYPAGFDQEKTVGWFLFMKNNLVGFKLGFRSTFRHQTQMRWRHATKERVIGNAFLDVVHASI